MGRNNTITIETNVKDIDETKLNRNNFDEKYDVLKAIKKLECYDDIMAKKIKANFDEPEWVFIGKVDYIKFKFDFGMVYDNLRFTNANNNDKQLLLLAFKSWIAIQLSEKGLGTVQGEFNDLYSAIYATSGFSDKLLDSFTKQLDSNNVYRVNSKGEFMISSIDNYSFNRYIKNIIIFLKYFNQGKYSDYILKLEEIRHKIKIEYNNRKIPSSCDVMKFKMYIEDWFIKISNDKNKASIDELIRFYPVYLWWIITSIIPMRPSEFCLIKRNCISTHNNKYYITFPRIKLHRKGENRINMKYDTLPIP